MKKDNEKGFALILSLVLLLVMSLMGGSLIVISAGDHRNNNISDTYQQTFYVAETALLEGEKYIINQYLGPRASDGTRDKNKKNKPINANEPGKDEDGKDYTDCYNSFPGLPGPQKKEEDPPQTEFEVVIHSVNLDPATNEHNATTNRIFNFGTLLADIFNTNNRSIFPEIEYLDKEDTYEPINKEKEYLDRFQYEYFVTKLGPAPFRGFGMSIKKGSGDTGLDGIAYRIYGCGTYTESPEIVVPLESTIVLPN